MARRKQQQNLRSTEQLRGVMTQSSINGGGEVVLYEAPDGEIRLDVTLKRDTVWLTQVQMGELFDKNVRTILEQIRGVGRFFSYRNFRITIEESGLLLQGIDGGTKGNDVTFQST